MPDPAFEKRLKRRIIGRPHLFFAVCPPGLTALCKKEIIGLFPGNDSITQIPGGIEFSGKLSDLYTASLNLRCPSRILMRIGSFSATRFDVFEKHMEKIDWELFLPPGGPVKCRVSVQKSRLYHSDAIALRASECIRHRLKAPVSSAVPPAASPGFEQTLFIRGDDDVFDLSLDTSGPGLYKRGIKTGVTQAPIRENLAFAVLMAAGFEKQDILIDPMCGSGTFSLEAAMIQSCIPAGFFRSFAFESWPGFKKKQFDHIKKQAAEKFCLQDQPSVFASDMDRGAIKTLEDNLKNTPFGALVQVEQRDFFDIQPTDMTSEKGVVVLNPPYGKRLTENGDVRTFYRQIGVKLKQDFKGWRYGIVLPSKHLVHHLGLPMDIRPFFHGGLDIFAGVGTV